VATFMVLSVEASERER